MDDLKKLIREVQDFPKPGILFYDITTLLKDPAGLRGVIDSLKDHYQHAGVDLVIGIEGSASGSTMRGSTNVGLPLGNPGDLALVQANTDFLASVTGRIGYAFDTVLLYAKGGFAVAGDKYNVSSGDFGGLGPYNFQGLDNRYGWTAGGGVDWAFSRHWSMNVEYDYYKFGNGNILMSDPLSGGAGVVDVKQTVQVVKVGVNFHIWGSGW